MLAAPAIDLSVASFRPRKTRWAALALSLLLHASLALVWLGFPHPEARHEPEHAMEVEIAQAPEPAAPPREPGRSHSQGLQGDAPPVPQLEPGILASRSSPPRENSSVTDATPPSQAAEKPKKPAPVTQSERDFVLSQVLRNWHPPKELSAYDKASLRLSVVVGADGYFADIYDARRPWNPTEVFDGYAALPQQNLQRRTIDAFYQAIRKAQPVRLPPALKAKAPFPVRLDFRLKDIR